MLFLKNGKRLSILKKPLVGELRPLMAANAFVFRTVYENTLCEIVSDSARTYTEVAVVVPRPAYVSTWRHRGSRKFLLRRLAFTTHVSSSSLFGPEVRSGRYDSLRIFPPNLV